MLERDILLERLRQGDPEQYQAALRELEQLRREAEDARKRDVEE